MDGRKQQAGQEEAYSMGRPHADLLSGSLASPLWPPSTPGCNSTIWALRPAETSETCCYMTNARSPLSGECEQGPGGRLRLFPWLQTWSAVQLPWLW